jgi:UDP-N-acetylmuramate-alanine ligase
VAAIASTLLAGGNAENVASALREFKGAKRRFEVIARTEMTVYVDDYAHHPAELEATIAAARLMYPGKKITGVFQPHLFSRTRDFADAFAAALDKLDNCLLLPIYPARRTADRRHYFRNAAGENDPRKQRTCSEERTPATDWKQPSGSTHHNGCRRYRYPGGTPEKPD